MTHSPSREGHLQQRRTLPLARIRWLRGHSQASLGHAAGGLHRNTIYALEHGRQPNMRTALRVAAALGVEVADLWPSLRNPSQMDGGEGLDAGA
jgi:DNA-binding XRE family transcriptional regulator